jgi:hypothetical protein
MTVTITAESRTELDRTRFYIDGQWVDPKGTGTHQALEAAICQLGLPGASPSRGCRAISGPIPQRRFPAASS